MVSENESDVKKSVEITAKMIKAVRKETRAGALDCKHALEVTSGDIEKAIKYLIKHGKSTPKISWI